MREGEDSAGRQTAKNKDRAENARRAAKSKGKVDEEKKREEKEEEEGKKKKRRKKMKRRGDGERFHEESGWLTDDLIKRGTNYRPAGC